MSAAPPLQPSECLDPARRDVAILANPHAGTGRDQGRVDELVAALRSREMRPFLIGSLTEFSAFMAGPEAAALRCVVAAGGDGTLLEVLNRAPGQPVALLPRGNENLVATYFRQPRDAARVAEAIAAGRIVQADLGRINGRLFCVMAGIGIDADVVRRVHSGRRGHINKLTYFLAFLQSLWSYGYPELEIELPETGERLRGAMAFVFNIPYYARGLPLAPGARPDDGLLDVYVFEKRGNLAFLRYLLAVSLRRQSRLQDHHYRTARRVIVQSSLPAPLQTDGDPAGELPAEFETVPGGLRLVVANGADR